MLRKILAPLFLWALVAVAGADPLLLPVEDVFTISGRGVVVTGTVQRGTVKREQAIEIVGYGETLKATVVGVESNRTLVEEAGPGQSVGLILRGVQREQLSRGQVLAEPGSLRAVSKFEGRIDMATAGEGGRRTPFLTGYRPQFRVWGADVSGQVSLPPDRKTVAPGDKDVPVVIDLERAVGLEKGVEFVIREGGRVIGTGRVMRLLP